MLVFISPKMKVCESKLEFGMRTEKDFSGVFSSYGATNCLEINIKSIVWMQPNC